MSSPGSKVPCRAASAPCINDSPRCTSCPRPWTSCANAERDAGKDGDEEPSCPAEGGVAAPDGAGAARGKARGSRTGGTDMVEISSCPSLRPPTGTVASKVVNTPAPKPCPGESG